jgi:pimeloyl-ACP methyl ester carboxylesterase
MRFIKIIGIVIVSVTVIAVALICFTGPVLPDDIDDTINVVMKSELPEFLQGDTGFVKSGDTRIWFESIGPTVVERGAVLLFMGISNDALGWPQGFIESLIDSGFRVIRFDYRGTGMSDWIEDWKESPYALADLANDAVAILNTLGIKRAHLVGISLGGMVAQEFAIDHPERTLTLASIMSSGNIVDKSLPGISLKTTFDLIKIGLKYGIIPSEKNTIKLHVAARIILRGDATHDIDVRGTARQVLYNLRKRNGYNSEASRQHHQAVYRSGSRYEKLKDVQIPTLIIHGLKDPFIPIEHSKKLASILPNSTVKWFENMGHDVPPALFEPLINALIKNFEKP